MLAQSNEPSQPSPGTPPSDGNASSEGHTRLAVSGDSAKQSITEDVLGLQNLVSGLADVLIHTPANGYVLGLEGKWGSGKSSLANFISEEIKAREQKHHVIRFEPWLIGDKDGMLSLFFGLYAAALDQVHKIHYPIWHWKRWFGPVSKKVRQYGRHVGSLAASVGAFPAMDPLIAAGLKTTGVLARLFGTGQSALEKLKREIAQQLCTLESEIPGLRFTVVVDDTDRLEPAEAVEILRLVRKVADFPITNYLICFDLDVLSRQIEKGLQIENGHDFIEKMLQNIVSVPPHEPFALRRQLRRLLIADFPEEMGDTALDDTELEFRKHILFDQWAGKLISTPRDLVRLHDAVKFGWPSLAGNADFLDFVWLQLVKLKSPKLYTWIKEYLVGVGAYRDKGRPDEGAGEREADKLWKIMDELSWGERHYHSGIGSFLPGVGGFVLNNEHRKVYQFARSELAKFEQNKRLGSPSHWRRYFAFEMPSYAVSDEEIAAFRRAVIENTAHAAEVLKELARKPHDSPGHFLETLLDRLADLPSGTLTKEEMAGMARAFSAVMDGIARETKEIARRGSSEVWRTAASVLNKDASEEIVAATAEAHSVNWLASLLRNEGAAHGRSGERAEQPNEHRLTSNQLDDAIKTLTNRIAKLEPAEVFKLPQPSTILFLWLQLGDKDQLAEFITKSIQNDEMFLHFLNGLRGWQSSNAGIRYPLRKSYIAMFTDAEAAETRLKDLAKNSDFQGFAKELVDELTA